MALVSLAFVLLGRVTAEPTPTITRGPTAPPTATPTPPSATPSAPTYRTPAPGDPTLEAAFGAETLPDAPLGLTIEALRARWNAVTADDLAWQVPAFETGYNSRDLRGQLAYVFGQPLGGLVLHGRFDDPDVVLSFQLGLDRTRGAATLRSQDVRQAEQALLVATGVAPDARTADAVLRDLGDPDAGSPTGDLDRWVDVGVMRVRVMFFATVTWIIVRHL